MVERSLDQLDSSLIHRELKNKTINSITKVLELAIRQLNHLPYILMEKVPKAELIFKRQNIKVIVRSENESNTREIRFIGV